jgi:hypothetical protein
MVFLKYLLQNQRIFPLRYFPKIVKVMIAAGDGVKIKLNLKVC